MSGDRAAALSCGTVLFCFTSGSLRTLLVTITTMRIFGAHAWPRAWGNASLLVPRRACRPAFQSSVDASTDGKAVHSTLSVRNCPSTYAPHKILASRSWSQGAATAPRRPEQAGDAQHPLWLVSQSAWTRARAHEATASRLVGRPYEKIAHLTTTSRAPASHATWMTRARAQLDVLADRTGASKSGLVVSFMLLHELTAGVPWVLLFYGFNWAQAGVHVLQWLVPTAVWASLMASDGDDRADDDGNLPRDGGAAEHHTADDDAQAASLPGRISGWVDEVIGRARKKGRYGYHAEQVDGQTDWEAVKFNQALPKQEVMAGALADAVAAYLVVKVSTCVHMYIHSNMHTRAC